MTSSRAPCRINSLVTRTKNFSLPQSTHSRPNTHAAILYLLKAARYDGSALALVRPLIDGAYRAHWIYSCAKPVFARIKNSENVYPRLINMADEIEKKVNADGLIATITPTSTPFTATRTEGWSN